MFRCSIHALRHLGWALWRLPTVCWLWLEPHHVPQKPQVFVEYPKSLNREQIISFLHRTIGAGLSRENTVSYQSYGNPQPAERTNVAKPLSCATQYTCLASGTVAGCCSDTAECETVGFATACAGFDELCNDNCLANSRVLKWYASLYNSLYFVPPYHDCTSDNPHPVPIPRPHIVPPTPSMVGRICTVVIPTPRLEGPQASRA